MTAPSFTDVLRTEHRAACDILLAVGDAFRARDTDSARSLLWKLAWLVGPHFRYEEESLFPSMSDAFGSDHVNQLLHDHDDAVHTVRRLLVLVDLEPIDDAAVEEAVAGTRSLLSHIGDCDALSLMVERLDDGQIDQILQSRRRAIASEIDLLTWAAIIRQRPLCLVSHDA